MKENTIRLYDAFCIKGIKPGSPVSFKIEEPTGLCGSVLYSGDKVHLWVGPDEISFYDAVNPEDMNYDKVRQAMEACKEGKEVCSKCHKVIEGKSHWAIAARYCDACYGPSEQRGVDDFFSYRLD